MKIVNLFLAFCPLFCFAQEKVPLTKGETVNYLNRLVQKAQDYRCISAGCATHGREISLVEESFKEDNDFNVTYEYKTDKSKKDSYCGWDSYTFSQTFNPANITSVELDPENYSSPVYAVYVKFGNKALVKCKKDDDSWQASKATFYFLLENDDSIEKIKKAFYHLRDLIKAEDDPF